MRKIIKFLNNIKSTQEVFIQPQKVEPQSTPGTDDSPFKNITAIGIVHNKLIGQNVKVNTPGTDKFYTLTVTDVLVEYDIFYVRGVYIDWYGDGPNDYEESLTTDWIPQQDVYVNLFL